MESQEAKLYRGNEYVKSLCLIGNNDDFDEIVVEPDGTMTVATIEDYLTDDGGYEQRYFTYEGITRINFK